MLVTRGTRCIPLIPIAHNLHFHGRRSAPIGDVGFSMFKVTRVSPIRIDVEFGGKLDGDEMNAALDELVSATEGIEHGQLLCRVGEFALPTFEGLKVEFSRLPSMIGLIRKFRRCAVMAEQGWLKTISELEGALIPGVEIKGFALDHQATAEAWLEQT